MSRASTKLVTSVKTNGFTEIFQSQTFLLKQESSAKKKIFITKMLLKPMTSRQLTLQRLYILRNFIQFNTICVGVKNCVSELPEKQKILVFKMGLLLFSSILGKVAALMFLGRLLFQLYKPTLCICDFKASD